MTQRAFGRLAFALAVAVLLPCHASAQSRGGGRVEPDAKKDNKSEPSKATPTHEPPSRGTPVPSRQPPPEQKPTPSPSPPPHSIPPRPPGGPGGHPNTPPQPGPNPFLPGDNTKPPSSPGRPPDGTPGPGVSNPRDGSGSNQFDQSEWSKEHGDFQHMLDLWRAGERGRELGIFEERIREQFGRNLPPPQPGRWPNPPIQPGVAPQPARGWYTVAIPEIVVTRQTSDDGGGDRPGDEVFLSGALGYYDRDTGQFTLITSFKSQRFEGLTNGRKLTPNIRDSIETFPLELNKNQHVLIFVPVIWESDDRLDDEGGLGDRAARLNDLMRSFEGAIGEHVAKLANAVHGPKDGRELGFPYVSYRKGSTGGNRPVGMKTGKTGALEFYPQVLVMDFKEAERLQSLRNHVTPIHYYDDQESGLGGNYTLNVQVTRVH